jgi:hypothetical protein
VYRVELPGHRTFCTFHQIAIDLVTSFILTRQPAVQWYQFADTCGLRGVDATVIVKFGGVEVFKKDITLSFPGDELTFYVHAHRVNTVYGVEVEERGFCLEEGTSGGYGDN